MSVMGVMARNQQLDVYCCKLQGHATTIEWSQHDKGKSDHFSLSSPNSHANILAVETQELFKRTLDSVAYLG